MVYEGPNLEAKILSKTTRIHNALMQGGLLEVLLCFGNPYEECYKSAKAKEFLDVMRPYGGKLSLEPHQTVGNAYKGHNLKMLLIILNKCNVRASLQME